MLKKIVSINNVGRFANCTPHGDVEFKRITMIYADNGAGKTTLCDVFRSLGTGDGTAIQGRSTLGSASPPKMEIRIDPGSSAHFSNGAWSQTVPAIRIFDDSYVADNVFDGEGVAHEQKRNLYKVIVGSSNVAAAKSIEDLNAVIRGLTTSISTSELALNALKPSTMSLEIFLGLSENANVDKQVKDAEQRLPIEQRATEIIGHAMPSPLLVPLFPRDIEDVLLKTLKNVFDGADARVRAHIKSAHAEESEGWISDGLAIVGNGKLCAFCGASLEGNELLKAYKTYFSDEYLAIKGRVESVQSLVEAFCVVSDTRALERDAKDNATALAYFHTTIETPIPSIDLSKLPSIADAVRTEALALLKKKREDILSAVMLSTGYSQAKAVFDEQAKAIQRHNSEIAKVLEALARKKLELGRAKPHETEALIEKLKATRARFEPKNKKLCDTTIALRASKRAKEQAKEAAQLALKKATADTIVRYETSINTLLNRFGARFQLADTKGQQLGGAPSATFQIEINNVAIPVGAADTPLSEPSFRNTLSAGDRRTLALALFLVETFSDPSLKDTIVILDDPFTSQDSTRRAYTKQQIAVLADRAAQVVLLSHDKYFLNDMRSPLRGKDFKFIQVAHFPHAALIEPCDIQRECASESARDHETLLEFSERRVGDPRTVRERLRPFIEGYLRFRLPDQFSDTDSLGTMIEKITSAAASDPKSAAQGLLPRLAAINEYSIPRQHAQMTPGDTSGADEVATCAEDALSIVRGFEQA